MLSRVEARSVVSRFGDKIRRGDCEIYIELVHLLSPVRTEMSILYKPYIQ